MAAAVILNIYELGGIISVEPGFLRSVKYPTATGLEASEWSGIVMYNLSPVKRFAV